MRRDWQGALREGVGALHAAVQQVQQASQGAVGNVENILRAEITSRIRQQKIQEGEMERTSDSARRDIQQGVSTMRALVKQCQARLDILDKQVKEEHNDVAAHVAAITTEPMHELQRNIDRVEASVDVVEARGVSEAKQWRAATSTTDKILRQLQDDAATRADLSGAVRDLSRASEDARAMGEKALEQAEVSQHSTNTERADRGVAHEELRSHFVMVLNKTRMSLQDVQAAVATEETTRARSVEAAEETLRREMAALGGACNATSAAAVQGAAEASAAGLRAEQEARDAALTALGEEVKSAADAVCEERVGACRKDLDKSTETIASALIDMHMLKTKLDEEGSKVGRRLDTAKEEQDRLWRKLDDDMYGAGMRKSIGGPSCIAAGECTSTHLN